jgi:hypothetical protein
MIEGGIVVKDEHGEEVDVTFGATSDNRSVHAHVEGVGFIGGWQYPHKAMPWEYLVKSINRGIVYHDMNHLPKSLKRKKKFCRHCGEDVVPVCPGCSEEIV